MLGDARQRLTRGVLLLAGSLLATAAFAASASAITLPGAPLTVSIGPLGQCQSSYPGTGNNFYPATGAIGNCGFFLGFPEAGNPTFLQKKVFGFAGIQGGPGLSSQYTALAQSPVSGTGTAADPYKLVTIFKVSDASKTEKNDYSLVEDTTRYVNGEPQFSSTFDVENVTGEAIAGLSTAPAAPLKFHAIYAADLLTGDSDFGTSVLLAGPPRELAGANEATGVFGGFVEAPPPSPPWSNYQAGCWNVVPEVEGRCPTTSPSDGGIWAAVRAGSGEGAVFNDDVDPNSIDNGAGVSWDDHLGSALKPGEHAIYTIVSRAQTPNGLTVAPASQTRTVGQTASVLVTATDNTGTPYANRPIVYSIGEANPKIGSVLTNSAGVATISYVGTVSGADAMQVFLDLAGSGVKVSRDPAATAQVTWLSAAAAASAANSGYRLRSIRADSHGVLTIVLVPVQNGTAAVQVTVPTATISRNAAAAAKRLKCKRTQVVIKGRCRPRTTLSGRASASGKAGVAIRLTVRPSSRVTRALARGRDVQLTAKLSYKSRLGGKATVKVFHVKVKGKHRHRR